MAGMARHNRNTGPSPTLGDVVRAGLPELEGRHWFRDWKRKKLRRVAACGTGLLGWRFSQCDGCDSWEVRGQGCQDRYCSSCGVAKSAKWAADREEELIDATYFHYVFTVPGALYPLFFGNQRLCYKLFFDSVNATLKSFYKDPRFLGGTPPIFALLHTTNRELGYHPHIHVVIAGTGVNERTGRVVRTKKKDFLFPARALAAGVRGRVLSGLKKLDRMGVLGLDGRGRAALHWTLGSLYKVNWHVHTKKAFGGPRQAVRYLARYTHRTAISNARILRLESGMVTYTWTHRKSGNRCQRRLPVAQFLELFQKHILPRGFRRVRMWGALSGSKKKAAMARLRAGAGRPRLSLEDRVALLCAEEVPVRLCRCCGTGVLRLRRSTIRPAPRSFPTTLPIPPPVPSWLMTRRRP